MGDELVPIILFICMTVAVVGVAKLMSDARTRRMQMLLERGVTSEEAAELLASLRDAGQQASLRWGLVALAVGLALVIVQFLPYGAGEPFVYGLVLVFGAAGLLSSYFLARRRAAPHLVSHA